MKRVSVRTGNVALVYVREELQTVLRAGKHVVSLYADVKVYDALKEYPATIDFDILLQNEHLASVLTMVEVKEEQLALVYDKDRFITVHTPGRYAYFNTIKQFEIKYIDTRKVDDLQGVSVPTLLHYEMRSFVQTATVENYETGFLFVDSKLVKELEPGVHYFYKGTQTIQVLKADMRQMQLEVSGQDILTKDKAALRVSLHAVYRIVNAEKAIVNTKDYYRTLYVAFQLAAREYVGAYTLDELLENKDSVSETLLHSMEATVESMGVKVLDVGIKDIILPGEMKEIMNQVLIAQKKAQANTISRREETASTRSLLNTAKMIQENPVLMKLKEMEYIEKIAERIDSISVSGNAQLAESLNKILIPE